MSRDSQKQQDAAFQRNHEHNARIEEEAHLESTKKQITQQIDDLDRQISKLNKSFSGMIIDNEDRDQAHWDRNECTKLENQCNAWETKKAHPYKYRINVEFTEDGNHISKTYYVGVSPIVINEHEIVLSWTSDMGMFALNYSPEATVSGVPCKKTLRRVFDIQKGELKEFHDTLGQNTEQNETSYIDPFLLRLIKDERREHVTNTIIGSISQIQFDIISRPYNDNFIVQGYAGSGKTQIMLHRLSYLLANHPNLSSANARIISPSEIYKAFIRFDRETLSIDSISCATFEDYYIQLLKKYDHNDYDANHIEDERKSFGDSCSAVYLFENIFIDRYNHYFKNILHKLDVQKLNKIVIKASGGGISAHNYTRQTARNIIQTLEQVISTWDWKIKERERLVEKAQTAENALKIHSENLKHTEAELKSAASQLKAWAQVEREILQTQLDTHTQYQKYRRQIQANDREISKMRRRIYTIDTRLKGMPIYISPFPERILKCYDTIITLRDPISKEIHASLSDLYAQINSLIEKYQTHNRARYQDEITRLKLRYYERFIERAKVIYIDSISLRNEKRDLLNRLSYTTKQKETSQRRASTMVSALSKDKIIQRIAIIREIQQALNYSDYADLSSAEFSIYNEELRKYNALFSNIKTKINIVNKTISSVESLRDKLKSPAIEGVTDEEQDYLRECYLVAKKLEFDNIFDYLMSTPIIKQLKQQDKTYNRTCYRHKLYLRLLCCYLYNGPLLHGDAYLCIDEAQDAAPSEYDLLRNVLGPSCVFNLYGDVHQSIYQGHSIRNWSDLSRHKMEVLELDYNYRNTVEITEFCNREFHMNVKPIGITGEPVTIKTLNAAIQEAVQFQKQDAKRTVAILYHYDEQPISSMLHRLLDPEIMSWDKVEAGKISILSTTSAKGLEFDLAVVIPTGMVDNEKYIAYTRAVEQLIIVRA